jgi:AcrR family transcriptional regulator
MPAATARRRAARAGGAAASRDAGAPRGEAPASTRDAARSRAAIIDAAEALFAERGYAGTSLGDIGTRAGLSRGTPSYFYGSKEQLYVAVLERVFAAREEATAAAFAPLHAWAATGEGTLDAALTHAVEGYMAFLLERPTFVRLIEWEELEGGQRMRATPRASRAIQDAFGAARAAAGRRGLRAFSVEDAVLLFVSLTFSPLAQTSTFMATLGRDLTARATLRRHVRFVVGQLRHVLKA